MRQLPHPHNMCARTPKTEAAEESKTSMSPTTSPSSTRAKMARCLASRPTHSPPQPRTSSRTGTPNGPRLVLTLNQHRRLSRAEQLRRRQCRAREGAEHLVARVVPPAVEVLPAVGVVPPVARPTGGRRRHPCRRAAILPARRRGGCRPAGGASGCRGRRGGGPPRPPPGRRGGGGDRPASGAEGGPSAAGERGGGRGWHRGRGEQAGPDRTLPVGTRARAQAAAGCLLRDEDDTQIALVPEGVEGLVHQQPSQSKWGIVEGGEGWGGRR